MGLNRSCPICGCLEGVVVHQTRFLSFDNSPFPSKYDVVCCSDCGFVFADIKADQGLFDTYYELDSKYEDNTVSTSGGITPWDEQRLSDTAQIIADIIVSRIARIVDIGCGNGGLLKSLSESGFSNLVGVDPSPKCTRNVNNIEGVVGLQGSLDHLPAQLEFCDLVILSHVLEHVYNLQNALSNIHRILGPDGLLYVETPDAMNYRNYNSSPFQEFNQEHINHFSIRCLQNLLSINNFKPLTESSKIILSAKDKPYPTIFIFAEKAIVKPPSTISIIPDVDLIQSIREYVSDSNWMIYEFGEKINRILENNKNLVVWGTGALALKLLVYTSLGQAEIECFVDGNPINHGKSINGIVVKPPESLYKIPNIPILITTTLHSQMIIEQIKAMGLKNQVYSL